MVKRFKLVDELGEGTMGRVFIAEDTVLKRHVALKLLPAKFKDGRPNHRTERLIREARSAASLEHPNAVNVYEIDQSGGVHYIAMELAEGGNLEQLVQLSGPMDIERACQLVAEAAEALAHAHKRGIIHRDIKPANLLLTRAGRCKLCDFGLALIDDTPDAEGRMRCVGTPNYIAPEIASGQGATESSDLYSLGCTLFFLLTGRAPFNGTSAREVMKQHISQPLPDIRKWRPDVPEKLASAIEKACEKQQDDRYDSAERFAKVLRTFTIPTGKSGSMPVAVSATIPLDDSKAEPIDESEIMPAQTATLPPAPEPAGSFGDHPGMPPISAAQLAAIMPAPDKSASRGGGGGPLLWAGIGTVVAAGLIGLGIWYAKNGLNNNASSASGAPPATPAVASVAPVATPSEEPPTEPSGERMLSLANSGMEEVNDKGVLIGWYVADRCKPNVRSMTEAGNKYMRVTNDDATTTVHADQKIDIDPSWKSITVSARMRASDFKPGKSESGVTFSFRDDGDKLIGKWPPPVLIKQNSPWVERSVTYDVPAGSKKLYLQCVISYATGTIDYDDVKITAQSK